MEKIAHNLIVSAQKAGLKLATVESCTGGLVAKSITDVPGASEVFEGGLITYSNEAKTVMAGVSESLLKEHGAVSEQVARVLAENGLARTRADVVVAVTGIAGPSGGSKQKPVGLVYIAVAVRGGKTMCDVCHFSGGRSAIRLFAAEKALLLLLEVVQNYRLSA